MRREIDRRLDMIGRMKHEPKLIPEGTGATEATNPVTLSRMQAMDDIKILGTLHHSYT